jgi:AAA domain
MEIRKAQRRKAKLRLGIAAPSGAGKTYSALLLAFGLDGKVGVIDTEHKSADLYESLGAYDVIDIEAPYTVDKYLKAISKFEAAGYSTIIIDSLTHAWAGDGGLLDKQGKIADSGKANGFAAWRTITPEHNSLVEAMLKSPCHIIATMRSKQEYVLETNEKGKQVPKKVGMAPIQRDGMEYEFTVMLDIDMQHIASASKDRTSLLDGRFWKITEDTGRELLQWLEAGVDQPQTVSVAERDNLLNAMADSGLAANRFCEKFAIASVADLPRSRIGEATQAIAEFKTARDAARAMKAAAEANSK